jgi:hypothetical protein
MVNPLIFFSFTRPQTFFPHKASCSGAEEFRGAEAYSGG